MTSLGILLLIGLAFVYGYKMGSYRPPEEEARPAWSDPMVFKSPEWRRMYTQRNPALTPLQQMLNSVDAAFIELPKMFRARLAFYAYWWAAEVQKDLALQTEQAIEEVLHRMHELDLPLEVINEMEGAKQAVTGLAEVADKGQKYVTEA